jgi:hypothetical protein
VGLDSERPMRLYLEAVRDGRGESSLADLERDMRRRGTYPDGGLRLDLAQLAGAGLVEEFTVAVEGRRRRERRWRISADGLATLGRFASGSLEAPAPEPAVFGEWHRVDGYSYSASCHPESMPGWAIWLGDESRGLESLVTGLVYAWVLGRSSRPPWVVTVRRARGVTLRRRIVHRVVLDDPDSAAALTAQLDRQLRAGRLPEALR